MEYRVHFFVQDPLEFLLLKKLNTRSKPNTTEESRRRARAGGDGRRAHLPDTGVPVSRFRPFQPSFSSRWPVRSLVTVDDQLLPRPPLVVHRPRRIGWRWWWRECISIVGSPCEPRRIIYRRRPVQLGSTRTVRENGRIDDGDSRRQV